VPAVKAVRVKAVAPKAPGEAQTVAYVHGIGNKPAADVLKCQWDGALFGFGLGERSRMAYWVDRSFHGAPEEGTCGGKDVVTSGAPQAGPAGIGTASIAELETQAPLALDVRSVTRDKEEQAVLLGIAEEIEANAAQIPDSEVRARSIEAKALWLPAPLRKWITRRITGLLLHDVHDFFYVEQRRRAMRESLLERLRPGGGPFVVIGHSQGSMIAWDVLSDLDPAEFPVELFITIGSPLGITEVKDQMKVFRGAKKLRTPECVKRWLNFGDLLDPVCLDKGLRGEYAASARGVEVEDEVVKNHDSPFHPHSATGYLAHSLVRTAAREAVDTAAFQKVASFRLARDLVSDLERGPSEARHEVLIELAAADSRDLDLDSRRRKVVSTLNQLQKGAGEALDIEELRHFVAARVTREEAETLAHQLGQSASVSFAVDRVWRNAKKVALLETSAGTVQATAGRIGYRAEGDGIHWAVLDTGIRADHPHFAVHANVVEQVDCRPGSSEPVDHYGHGTHVAGIIAGEYSPPSPPGVAPAVASPRVIAGIAPRTCLHIYKTLDDDGSGKDSWILRALDAIAAQNEAAGKAVIHGVNLSLGGSFDQSVYACGWSPLCRELRRLWRQGVLVVIAAGNEGFAVLQSDDGPIDANMDLSIGDPANLEDAVAVGSVHKAYPHSYGISYFSSRGPTADGRQKPDLVAPGEKIVSCRHRWRKGAKTIDDLYVAMSGTSMAAPHVSGLLAAFLSVRREFIGEPDKVKRILLDNCTDLQRDRPMQGAGMPNLVKMLVNT
jgi:pimeloyl-ACP methyl ester carboxylesterase